MTITDISEKSSMLFFKDVRKYDVLSKDVEMALFEEYHKNETSVPRKKEIRDIIILSNLRWCVTLSKKYGLQSTTQSDLISEAYKGMILSFSKFDYTKNKRFAYFASFYIQNEINNYIYGEGTIINDVSSNKVIDRLLTTIINKLEQELKRQPSANEVIDEFNKTKDDNIATLTDYDLHARLSKNTLMKTFDQTYNDEFFNVSLNNIIFNESDNADKELIINEKNKMLDNALSEVLTEREIKILKLSFGIGTIGSINYTNEMIATEVNLTRERVGQIIESSLKKLQNKKKLIKYLL